MYPQVQGDAVGSAAAKLGATLQEQAVRNRAKRTFMVNITNNNAARKKVIIFPGLIHLGTSADRDGVMRSGANFASADGTAGAFTITTPKSSVEKFIQYFRNNQQLMTMLQVFSTSELQFNEIMKLQYETPYQDELILDQEVNFAELRSGMVQDQKIKFVATNYVLSDESIAELYVPAGATTTLIFGIGEGLDMTSAVKAMGNKLEANR